MKGDRVDSGTQFSSPGKGVRSIKDKLMTRPRNRSRADYDALAQVKFLVSGKAILLLYIFWRPLTGNLHSKIKIILNYNRLICF